MNPPREKRYEPGRNAFLAFEPPSCPEDRANAAGRLAELIEHSRHAGRVDRALRFAAAGRRLATTHDGLTETIARLYLAIREPHAALEAIEARGERPTLPAVREAVEQALRDLDGPEAPPTAGKITPEPKRLKPRRRFRYGG